MEFVETLPEPPLNTVLTIVKAEVTQTLVRGLRGVRVEFEDSKGNRYATMLWIRERVGDKSKLGAFIKVLGKRPSAWVGKKVRIKKWSPREREVELVE